MTINQLWEITLFAFGVVCALAVIYGLDY